MTVPMMKEKILEKTKNETSEDEELEALKEKAKKLGIKMLII